MVRTTMNSNVYIPGINLKIKWNCKISNKTVNKLAE